MSKGQQSDVQQKIQNLLNGAEKERAQKRVAHGLAELGRGKIEHLDNSELLVFLPGYIQGLGESGSGTEMNSLLNVFEAAVLSGDVILRERSIALLSIAASTIVERGSVEQLTRISEIFTTWLETETELLPGAEIVALQMGQLLRKLLNSENWIQAKAMVGCVADISRGKTDKSHLIVRLAARILEKITDREMVQRLLKVFLDSCTEESPVAGDMAKILLGMGKGLVSISMDMLPELQEQERESLIDLLSKGDELVVVEIERLYETGRMSVQQTCDMVRILSRMNRASVYPRLVACLAHPATEVQHEMVRGIIRNGLHLVPRLLEALDVVADEMKVLVIKKLSQLSDKEINERFLKMLADYTDGMRITCKPVVHSLVVALGQEVRLENLSTLKALRSGLQFDTDSVLIGLTEASISRLELGIRRAEHRVVDDQNVEFYDDPVQLRQARELTAEVRYEVEELAAQGKIDEALNILKKKINEYIQSGKLAAAEVLRDLILKIDPGAIDTLLEVEELLVKQQQTGLSDNNMLLWKDFRSLVGPQVFEKIFGLAVVERYGDGETIIAQREENDNLYFLVSGTVLLHCGSGSEETFLKKIREGTILGAETIFDVSLSTVTFKAQGSVLVYSLATDLLAGLENEYPGTYQILEKYCDGQIDIPELLKMSGIDRRNQARRKVNKSIETKILDMYGVVGQRSLRGLMHNISYGGVCYEIGIENTKSVRRLLGRQMQIIFKSRDKQRAELNGKFVAFERNVEVPGKYRVHVRMLEPIDPKIYELIVQDTV
ncbi:cyclic nucleotide-binding domain-containing protein [Desulfosediminicola sp.]|uniref:cyclic nucleotide-binding domain-containing protein n=1 Tax=Desulfosediminicola sp. TaxID=2886825 RepID=UPI003AF22D00